jgi:hypothetical protein
MAGVAAWFAIAGIIAVFSGAPIAALVMGSVVELGKVVGVSWLYRNKDEDTKIKYALFPLVLIAMLLTSMGIFGFLSKAHLQQGAPVGNNVAKIEQLDQRIAREQYTIKDAETVIGQLDQTVNSLVKNDRISGPNGARVVRESQKEQRAELKTTIDEAQANVAKLEDEKFELSQTVREMELEVGPVKYIAELIYDDATTNLENAVRWVIIAFIFVFDPMAIVLLMAANFTLMQRKQEQAEQEDEQYEEDEPAPQITSIDQLRSTDEQPHTEPAVAGMTAEEIKKMISELGTTHETTPDEESRKQALEQLLKQGAIRDKMRTRK